MTGSIDDFVALLQCFYVDVGDAARRLSKAHMLHGENFDISQLRATFEHIEAHAEPRRVPRLVAALCLDPKKLRETIADLRGCAEMKKASTKQKEPERPPGDKPTPIAPLPGEDHKQWEYNRNCRIAFCRVISDRHPKERVARELGVDVPELGRMIEKGREMQTYAAKPSKFKLTDNLSEKEQEERRERFLAEMRSKQREKRA